MFHVNIVGNLLTQSDTFEFKVKRDWGLQYGTIHYANFVPNFEVPIEGDLNISVNS